MRSKPPTSRDPANFRLSAWLPDARLTIGRRGMVAEEPLHLARITTLLAAEDREEVRHGHGVVPGSGHDLRSDLVGLVFGVTAELEEDRVQPQAADRVHDLRRVAAVLAEQPAQYPEAGLAEIGLRGLVGPVAQRHVRHLVGQHAGQLRLASRRLEQAAVHVHRAAGEREGVDRGVVHGLDRVGIARARSLRRQLADDLVEVAVHVPVLQQRELPLGLHRGLTSDLDVLLHAEQVEAGRRGFGRAPATRGVQSTRALASRTDGARIVLFIFLSPRPMRAGSLTGAPPG